MSISVRHNNWAACLHSFCFVFVTSQDLFSFAGLSTSSLALWLWSTSNGALMSSVRWGCKTAVSLCLPISETLLQVSRPHKLCLEKWQLEPCNLFEILTFTLTKRRKPRIWKPAKSVTNAFPEGSRTDRSIFLAVSGAPVCGHQDVEDPQAVPHLPKRKCVRPLCAESHRL